MKKIAVIDLLFNWPPVGGSWVDVKGVCEHLAKRGFDICLFVPDFQDFFPRGRIEGTLPFPIVTIPFNRFSFNFWTLPRRFRREVRKFNPDFVFFTDGYFLKPYLLHSLSEYKIILRFYAYELFCLTNRLFVDNKNMNCNVDFLQDPSACFRCTKHMILLKNLGRFFLGRKMSFVFHELFISLAFLPGYLNYLKKSIKLASHIIVYNEFIKEKLKNLNERIIITPTGIDIELFRSEDEECLQKTVILAPGRFDDHAKGFSFLIQACDTLRSTGRDDFELWVTNSQDMNVSRNYIKSIGWIKFKALPSIYKKSSIVVIPSLWEEPFGIVAIEAMATGRPVIASRVGGLRNIVDDGITGFIVEPGDREELAKKIACLLDDRELRRKFGLAGRKKAECEYTWDRVIERVYLPILGTTENGNGSS